MFIELTEYLRCPSGHGDEYMVLTPDEMTGRIVVSGTLGCPICKRDFRIDHQIANLGMPQGVSSRTFQIDATDVQALLNVSGPGGYLALVGAAAMFGPALANLLEEVHFVGVNAPEAIQPSATLSLVTGSSSVPLRSQVVRGVVVGPDQSAPVLQDAARVLLKGLRFVVVGEGSDLPDGIELLASGNGLTVGRKV